MGLCIGMVVLALALVSQAAADIINVPADFPTIQQAVNNASAGDEIVISPGTYPENVIIQGRNSLILRSESGDPASTIVDGMNLGTVFRLQSCNDIAIEALSIRRGNGGAGGGIYLFNCSSIVIRANVIENNFSQTDGGGFFVQNSNVAIVGNRIVNNSANVNATLDGGGIFYYNSSGAIVDNWIQNNRGHEGGGIIINVSTNPSLLVEGNVIVENEATYYGAGIFINFGTNPQIRSNTIVGNSAGVRGGAVFYTREVTSFIANNIIAKNGAPVGGGVHAAEPGLAPAFACNDAWQNSGGNYTGFLTDPTGQNGNISADPLFCNQNLDNFTLDENSPCAPANSPSGCGLIGALDVACGATAVEPATWGLIKRAYLADRAKQP